MKEVIELLPEEVKSRMEIDLNGADRGQFTVWNQYRIFIEATKCCRKVRFVGFDKLFRKFSKVVPSLIKSSFNYPDEKGNKRSYHDTGYTDWSDYLASEDLYWEMR